MRSGHFFSEIVIIVSTKYNIVKNNILTNGRSHLVYRPRAGNFLRDHKNI